MKRSLAALVTVALVATSAAVFLRTIDNGFVGLDDDLRIYENASLVRPLSWRSVTWEFSRDANRAYMQPLTWLAFQADVALFGLDPRAFHATSVVTHAAVAGLLLLLLWRTTGDLAASATTAGLFALHPLVVEPVAWAVELNTLLAAVFALVALHAYVTFVRAPSVRRYAPVFAAYVASLLSKPWLFGLPLAMLALDFWPLRRWPPPDDAERLRTVRRLVLEKVPLLGFGAAWAVVAWHTMERGPAGATWITPGRPLTARLAHAPVAIVRYLGKLVAPTDLAVDYPFPDHLPSWQIAGGVAIVLAVTALAIGLRRRAPALLAGWMWFLAIVAPTLGVVQAGKWPAIADRFAYLPMIGLIAGVVFAASPLVADRRPLRWGAFAVLATAVATIAVVSRAQIGYWRDTVTLLSHSQAVAPGSAVVEYNLGSELGKQGRLREAEDLLRRAASRVDGSDVHNQLGNVLLLSGRDSEAHAEYERAVALNPANAEALYNLAHVLEAQGHFAEAHERYLQFVAAAPPSLESVKRQIQEALAR